MASQETKLFDFQLMFKGSVSEAAGCLRDGCDFVQQKYKKEKKNVKWLNY